MCVCVNDSASGGRNREAVLWLCAVVCSQVAFTACQELAPPPDRRASPAMPELHLTTITLQLYAPSPLSPRSATNSLSSPLPPRPARGVSSTSSSTPGPTPPRTGSAQTAPPPSPSPQQVRRAIAIVRGPSWCCLVPEVAWPQSPPPVLVVGRHTPRVQSLFVRPPIVLLTLLRSALTHLTRSTPIPLLTPRSPLLRSQAATSTP